MRSTEQGAMRSTGPERRLFTLPSGLRTLVLAVVGERICACRTERSLVRRIEHLRQE
jgi:hypothetical protein